MKSNFLSLLKGEIGAQMPAKLPEYEALRGRSQLTYVSKAAGNYHHFIQFQAENRPDRRRFTVNCAWTSGKSWPESAHYSIPFDTPMSEPEDPPPGEEYCFRIGFLFPPHRDHWWEVTRPRTLEEIIASMSSLSIKPEIDRLTDEQVAKLRSLVADAISKCRCYAITYFDKHSPK